MLHAVAQGKKECVKFLIERGANKNAVDNQRCSALHYAAIHNHVSCAKLLLEEGLNIELADECQTTSLHTAGEVD